MRCKYAVALLKGGEERILGIFNTKAEADEWGTQNKRPIEDGLQYCFAAHFTGNVPTGALKIYDYYNVSMCYN